MRARLLVWRARGDAAIHSCSAAKRPLAGTFLFLLLRQTLALLLQPGGVVAFVRVAAAALDLQDPAGDVVQEVTVMGDQHDRAGIIVQCSLQPSDAFGVQVVGRLVEQQQVGLFQQQPAEGDAPALAAGKRRDAGFGRRAAQRVQRDVDLAIQLPAIAGVDLRLQIGLFGEEIVHLLIAHRLGEFHWRFR